MNASQEFAIYERVRIAPEVKKYAGCMACVMDYGYHMAYNRDTGKMQRRYDYALLVEGGEHDGAAFRLRGKWLAAIRGDMLVDTIGPRAYHGHSGRFGQRAGTPAGRSG